VILYPMSGGIIKQGKGSVNKLYGQYGEFVRLD